MSEGSTSDAGLASVESSAGTTGSGPTTTPSSWIVKYVCIIFSNILYNWRSERVFRESNRMVHVWVGGVQIMD